MQVEDESFDLVAELFQLVQAGALAEAGIVQQTQEGPREWFPSRRFSTAASVRMGVGGMMWSTGPAHSITVIDNSQLESPMMG